MELRAYVKILLGSIWIIIPMTMLSLTATLLFSYTQQPIYEATSSYIIAFSGTGAEIDQADRYYILDLLVGRQQIGVNFCSAITAGDNVSAALEAIGVTEDLILDGTVDIDKYAWNCNVLPESSVLLLIVQGPSQEIVLRLNETLGKFGTERAQKIYNSMLTLEVLDSPYLEEEAISPNHIQNAVLGVALGIGVSLTIALLLDYLRSPAEKMEAASIRDPLTNAYNDRYFQKRLVEEVERSKQRNRPISVALLQLQTNEDFELLPQHLRDEFLHQAALYIQDKVYQGDIVAYRGDMYFEILLPETPGYEARTRLMVVHAALRSHLFRTEQYTTSFTSKIGIVESGGEALDKVDLLEKARAALRKAGEERTKHVHLISTMSSAFVMDESDFQLDEVLPEEEMIQRVNPDEDEKRNTLSFLPFGGRRQGRPDAAGANGRATLEHGTVGASVETISSPFGSQEMDALDTSEFDLEQQLQAEPEPRSALDVEESTDVLFGGDNSTFAPNDSPIANVEQQLDLNTTLPPDDFFFNETSDDMEFNHAGLFDESLPYEPSQADYDNAAGNGDERQYSQSGNFDDFIDFDSLITDEDTSEIATLYYDPTTDMFGQVSDLPNDDESSVSDDDESDGER